MAGSGEQVPQHLLVGNLRQFLFDDVARLEDVFFDLVSYRFDIRRLFLR